MTFERGISQPTTARSREERVSSKAEEAPIELPPDAEDIKAFFRTIGREDLVGPDASRDRLAREAALLDALEATKFACTRDWKELSGEERKTRQAEVNHLRKLIWRLSTLKENAVPSKTEAVASARGIAHDIEEAAHERTSAPDDYHDWKEAQTERAELYRLLAEAFAHDTVGTMPIPHTFLAEHPHILAEHGPNIKLTRFFDQIEYEYRDRERKTMRAHDRRQRKIAEAELYRLRTVRDELYLSFLFPKLAEAMHASEEREREGGEKKIPRKRAA